MSKTPLFNPTELESRWQERWEKDGIYHSDIDEGVEKHYALTMLPYPSGDLHIGHWYAMTPSDARARFMRMQGYNVVFPMGFDAFGLPAENAAIKHNVHPMKWTYRNIERMQEQLRSMGAMFDWRREAISSDPKYYRWSQWFFLMLYKHDLAYRKMAPVDWCPSCNTTLAREQVWGEDRHCERCGTQVIKKDLDQWLFKTTSYADELLKFDTIDWPRRVRTLQTNWIGRSEGSSVIFRTEHGDEMEVFTTRPDTLWGATFMVLAPEHPLVQKVTTAEHKTEVDSYVDWAVRQTDIQRESVDTEKTGVFTGGYAINPVNDERIPIWIADYVLMTYGTGAIMAVPAHDQRDFEFARKYGLEIRVVIQPADLEPIKSEDMTESVDAYGVMVNSGPLTGTPAGEAFDKTNQFLEGRGTGRFAVNYRLRDWLISRQRYWGAPIPMIHCLSCGVVPVPEKDLPVLLPEDVEWLPTGESPLKLHPTWHITTCPECGGPANRDTDTMDTFMCSSWYHLRYLSPDFADGPFDPGEYDYWMPVDTYTGGIEHATMHLIYTRFFHKACRDMGITKGDEPMIQYRNQGIVLGEDSEKMSKSRGNVVAPDDLVQAYGADVMRAYLMFFSRWNLGGPWNSSGIDGVNRWVRRVWTTILEPGEKTEPEEAVIRSLRRKLHQTLISITHDFKEFEFNTIISSLMELMNEMGKAKQKGVWGTEAWDEAVEYYLLMLAPVAPHISEEIWGLLDKPYSIHQQSWPVVDEQAAAVEEMVIPIQVNGKLRDRITVPVGTGEEEIKVLALASEGVKKHVAGKIPRKVIYVPGRLVNVVV
jgi:leucyl-tRNA synthetase